MDPGHIKGEVLNFMTEKWYKQFWPWFLIAIPSVSIVLGVVIVYLATTTENSMVSDDYYKEGKAINFSLKKKHKAKQLNLIAGLQIENGNVLVNFKQALPPDPTAIKLDFFHATLEDKDFYIMLTRDANGDYRGALPTESQDVQTLAGKWRITLTPFDESWKIRRQISFPTAGEVILEP